MLPLALQALPTFFGTMSASNEKEHLSGVPVAVVGAQMLPDLLMETFLCPTNSSQILASAQALCLPLRKLQSLLALLDAGIQDFITAWEEGHLLKDGWSKAEIEHMLLALFQDSEYRRQAIHRIRLYKP